MAIDVIKTGAYEFNAFGVNAITSHATYSFFSGEITTTDSFEDNILDFGVGLAELYIVNTSVSGMAAFQFPEKYITTNPATPANVASGIVIAGDKVIFRHMNKRGLKLRSAVSGVPATVYVFGI